MMRIYFKSLRMSNKVKLIIVLPLTTEKSHLCLSSSRWACITKLKGSEVEWNWLSHSTWVSADNENKVKFEDFLLSGVGTELKCSRHNWKHPNATPNSCIKLKTWKFQRNFRIYTSTKIIVASVESSVCSLKIFHFVIEPSAKIKYLWSFTIELFIY